MARSIRSRAPAPPGAANGAGSNVSSGALPEAPLGGSRAEASRRLQLGAIGVVVVLLLIGLASIIKDRATQTESTAVAEAAATAAPNESPAAADPLAEAGVVPDIPTGAPQDRANSGAPTPRAPAAAPQDGR